MNLFSIYFSGSPVYFCIGLIALILIGISFVHGRLFIWRHYPLTIGARVLISAFVLLLFTASHFNVGYKQQDLHRNKFDTPMTSDSNKEPPIRHQDNQTTKEKFNQQLQNLKQENNE